MLVGHNGSGKTTLLKMLLGEVQPDGGELELGARVDIGYLAQQAYPADHKKSVLAYFCEEAKLEEGEARGRLAAYLFYGADVFKVGEFLVWRRMDAIAASTARAA